MVNIDFCIWGCRDGFEVIHSENESWKNYLIANSSLGLDKKMQKLINSLDEFYMLNNNNGNQVISLVVPIIDKGDRHTYMVISLIIKQNISFGSKLFDVLQKIWGIYERDNFIAGDSKTRGKHLTSNEFDVLEIKNLINSLNVDSNSRFYQLSNSTVLVDDYNLLKNELGKFKGDAVYLIDQKADQAAFNKLPQNIKLLSEIISKGVTLPELDEFRILLKQRQNFDSATDLFRRLQANLTQQEIIDYSVWSNDISKDLDSKNLIALVLKQVLSEEEKAFAQHHDKNNTPSFLTLTSNQIEILRQKINSSDEIPTSLIESLKNAIDKAEQSNWNGNPKEWEDLLLSKPIIKSNLERKYIDNLSFWRKKFNEKEEKDTKATLENWYGKIKNATPKDISKNLVDWRVKITSLSHRILSLQNTSFSEELKTSQEYIFLTSKEWEPKIRKPNFKLISSIVIIGLFIGLFFLYQNWKTEKEILAKSDTDRDGIIDSKDQEKNTPWIADTSNYKLKNYINTTNGFIDTSKTKKLCDCWDFPDINDRKILKCKDNLNWFVYEGKLYYFDSITQGDGNFYFEEGKKVKSGNDDGIEKHHKRNNEKFYKETENQDLEATAADQTEIVTITYQGKKYQIKRGFTADKGNEFGKKGGDGFIPIWRFIDEEDKWLKQSSKGGSWKDATESDIKTLLDKVCEEIKSNKEKKPKASEKETEKSGDKKVKNNPPVTVNKNGENTSADIYWINLDKESEEKIQSKGREIDNAIRNMPPTTQKGKAAQASVLNKRDNY